MSSKLKKVEKESCCVSWFYSSLLYEGCTTCKFRALHYNKAQTRGPQ